MASKAKVLVVNIEGQMSRSDVEDALRGRGIEVTDFDVVRDSVPDNSSALGAALAQYLTTHPSWRPFNTTLTFQFSDGDKSYINLFGM